MSTFSSVVESYGGIPEPGTINGKSRYSHTVPKRFGNTIAKDKLPHKELVLVEWVRERHPYESGPHIDLLLFLCGITEAIHVSAEERDDIKFVAEKFLEISLENAMWR